MSSLSISLIVFACVFGGALFGIFLRTILPEHHLDEKSKDIVKLGMGLVGTMAALVLGLLIASAQGSFNTMRSELIQGSSNIIVLDRLLADYGPETKEARDLLRRAVEFSLNQIWPVSSSQHAHFEPTVPLAEALFQKIHALSPKNEAQRSIKDQALSLAFSLRQIGSLMSEQMGRSIPIPFLAILIFWITVIFISFGLFAPSHATVIATLFVCALSVSGAIFLILELDQPFGGLIKISSTPLHNALAHLGQ